MANNNTNKSSTGGFLSSLLDRLGSMNLAVLLLLALCFIMLAGTLTEQQQSMAYYRELYGPFWSSVFEVVQMFNLYHSPWFLLIVLLLFSSIFACIWRNAPRILQSFGKNAREYHPGKFTHTQKWEIPEFKSSKLTSLEAELEKRRFDVNRSVKGNEIHLYARKGSVQKLGYLFIHLAILIIIIGGLLDGRALSILSLQGHDDSRNSNDPFTMVQSLSVAEPVTELRSVEKGVERIQKLPFTLQVTESSQNFYANGQVRDYSANISITPEDGSPAIEGEVSAETSLKYEDYTIAHRGHSGSHGTVNLSLYQFGDKEALIDEKELSLPYQHESKNPVYFVIEGFRGHNADPSQEVDLTAEFKDIGPSMTYQLVDRNEKVVKFDYYLVPVVKEGRNYQLIRATAAKSAPVLVYIPLRKDSGLNRFLAFNDVLYARDMITLLLNSRLKDLFTELEIDSKLLHQELVTTLSNMLSLYTEGGRERVVNSMLQEFKKEADQETATLFIEKMLDSTLLMLYEQVLRAEKGGAKKTSAQIQAMISKESSYISELIVALEQLKSLGINIVPVVHEYKQRQAVLLSISKLPGKYAVISGMLILLLGVLIIFYVNYREYFIRMVVEQQKARVQVDGYTNRQDLLFDYEFGSLTEQLRRISS